MRKREGNQSAKSQIQERFKDGEWHRRQREFGSVNGMQGSMAMICMRESSAIPARARPYAPLGQEHPRVPIHFTGTSGGAPLFFTRIAMILAGFVPLAFLPTT